MQFRIPVTEVCEFRIAVGTSITDSCGCMSLEFRIPVMEVLETRTPATKPHTVADMTLNAGPVGRVDVTYVPDNYNDLLDWLYRKQDSQPTSNLIPPQLYVDIKQFLEVRKVLKEGQKKLGSTGQLHSSKWRYKMRQQSHVMEGKEGKPEVYKAVDVTDDVPTGRLRLVQTHEPPEVLHVNTLGHAGLDKTVAEVRL